MMSDHVRAASRTCHQAFAFLTEEFGYRQQAPTFEKAGFTLRYRGSVVGVLVDWHPREPLTVWLVRLVSGEFPARVPITPDSTIHYFELEDLEAITGTSRPVGTLQLYSLPDQTNAELLAASLRSCGAKLLAGDLAQFALLSERVKKRVRDAIASSSGSGSGPGEAGRQGW